MQRIKIISVIVVLFFSAGAFAKVPHIYLNKTHNTSSFSLIDSRLELHEDSIHRLNFRYSDNKRGIKPFFAPTLLIATGTTFHFSTDIKYNFQNWTRNNFSYSGSVDDYLQYAPLAAVYSLNLFGIQGENNFGNRTAIALKSILLNDFIVSHFKRWTGSQRPNGGMRSFPSGHTSVAFALAHFMHHEYRDRSIWYSIGAYTTAATVGVLRIAQDAHWISDVLAGAGFGMLSTELVYLTHLYKWDNEHIKNFDIFPFRVGNQKGITLIYNF
ncbi:MAG: phosphatase PAP2 family protein [Prolixibacteraceae bacterium]|nr:phosphatase PAP2 family protein [Prolixibacteraceae bacterium]